MPRAHPQPCDLGADTIGAGGLPLTIEFAAPDGDRWTLAAPRAPTVHARRHAEARIVVAALATFRGSFVGRQVRVGAGAQPERSGRRRAAATAWRCGREDCDGSGRRRLSRSAVGPICHVSAAQCGNGVPEPATEDCDGADDAACPGRCQPDCVRAADCWRRCHAIGPSVLNNATASGGRSSATTFVPGAQLELSDQLTGQSSPPCRPRGSHTRDHGAGARRYGGAERHPARAASRGHQPRRREVGAADIGHCATDIGLAIAVYEEHRLPARRRHLHQRRPAR